MVPVEPQVFDVLAYLVRHRDRVVPKTELLDEVWGDRFVSESALTSRIKSVRRAIGDTGRDQRVIKTIHGRGYRFVADVAEVAEVGEVVDAPAGGGAAAGADRRPGSDGPPAADRLLRTLDDLASGRGLGAAGGGRLPVGAHRAAAPPRRRRPRPLVGRGPIGPVHRRRQPLRLCRRCPRRDDAAAARAARRSPGGLPGRARAGVRGGPAHDRANAGWWPPASCWSRRRSGPAPCCWSTTSTRPRRRRWP